MDHGMELKGCICRIKNCAVELFSMEEDLVIDDGDSWELVERDLLLKATFLYIELGRVISCYKSEERKKALSVLVDRFFYFLDEVRIHFPSSA
jgi:photosystem II oxygen-evolving enhancer protein 3